ncbi:hypothetical protein TYRP_006546 [Tyrophagus putrescentiae]|nr:hypothetical protein TYRP_006546 [Tyrophagus putrescentiae]
MESLLLRPCVVLLRPPKLKRLPARGPMGWAVISSSSSSTPSSSSLPSGRTRFRCVFSLICTRIFRLDVSMRLEVFTVSPKRQYLNGKTEII